MVGTAKFPGVRIYDTRMIRLFEVLLHAGTTVAAWHAAQIHQAILAQFAVAENRYTLNQLCHDLRKLKAHGMLQRDGKR